MGATFTSFYFLCFYACMLIIYYLIPKKTQWIFLLLSSIAYYLLSGNGVLILYPVCACVVAYVGIRLINGTDNLLRKRAALAAVVLLLVGVLFVLKYINFGIHTINGIAGLFGAEEIGRAHV